MEVELKRCDESAGLSRVGGVVGMTLEQKNVINYYIYNIYYEKMYKTLCLIRCMRITRIICI